MDVRAARFLESLDKPLLQRLDKAILSLANDPRPPGCKRLKGRQRDRWRIRVGAYRVLYRINDEERAVLIYDIGHRGEIYR
jgi:mRNA interferase RelE/StbE